MVSLKIELDARQARQEAQQTTQALDTIGKSAETIAPKIDTIGKNLSTALSKPVDSALKLNRAIETVGEVTQVGARVRLLGEEVRNLGSGLGSVSGVAQGLAGALIDVSQITEKTGGSFSALATVLRANPILAAAGVLSLVATAMSLFGSNTKDTNTELERQIQLQEELRRASTDLALQLQKDADFQRVGLPVDFQQSALTRVRRLTETASSLAGQSGFQTFGDLAKLTGLSEADIRGRVPSSGIVSETFSSTSPLNGQVTTRTVERGITNEAAREVLLILAREARVFSQLEPTLAEQNDFRRRQQELLSGPGAVLGPELPPGGLTPGVVSNANLLPDIRPVDPQAYQAALREDQQALAEFNRELAQTRQLGEDVGTALGNSFFGFLQNANNARQVLVGLLQQLSAIAQAQIVRGFANQVGNLFVSTAAQSAPRTPGTEAAS